MHQIIHSPDYLAYKFDFNSEMVEFLPISRAEIRKVAWLKKDQLSGAAAGVEIPLADVIGEIGQVAIAATSFIFHTAYCASTYLSRCLDVVGHSISLREPQLLLDAANAKRLNWRSTTTQLDYAGLLHMALKLFAKHADDGERLIIKPINSVNNIISELLTAVPSASSLLLYTDARNFTLSALKKGEAARQTLRAMFDLLRCDFPHLANLRLSDAIHMSDLKVMLTLWRLQQQQAESALQSTQSADTMRSLYAEDLIADKASGLLAASQFLQLGITHDQIDEIISSDLNTADAKQPTQQFSTQQRAERYAELEHFFGDDIENGLRWLQANNPKIQLDGRLSQALELTQHPG